MGHVGSKRMMVDGPSSMFYEEWFYYTQPNVSCGLGRANNTESETKNAGNMIF